MRTSIVLFFKLVGSLYFLKTDWYIFISLRKKKDLLKLIIKKKLLYK